MRTILLVLALVCASQAHAQSAAFVPNMPNGETRLTVADGIVFVEAPNGGIRHRLTGFVCPPAMAGARRTYMNVYDPQGGGRDVSCHYNRSDSDPVWYTLYLTNFPGAPGEQVFEAAVHNVRRVAGAAVDVPPPYATGEAPKPTYAAFWKEPGGLIQGMWASNVNSWNVRLRTTIRPGHELEAAAMAKAVYDQVYR